MSVDAVRWMHRRGVSVHVGDTGGALAPLDAVSPAPLHHISLVRLGMPVPQAPPVPWSTPSGIPPGPVPISRTTAAVSAVPGTAS
jgi:hypothetical protein